MTQPLLLALDLSTNVGWCLMRRYEAPRFGTLTLSGDIAKRLGEFNIWLGDTLEVEKPDGMAWERPILLRTDTVAKLQILYGLVGIAFAHRYRLRLPYCEAPIHDVKIALTGNGRADKDMMIHAAMRHLRWEVATEHEADAGGVGLCAYDRLFPKS